jgi:hypothetical protein
MDNFFFSVNKIKNGGVIHYACLNYELNILLTCAQPVVFFCRARATRGSPVTREGMGLGKSLDPSRVVGFLAGKLYSHGHGFGMAKPSGFAPVAISIRDC